MEENIPPRRRKFSQNKTRGTDEEMDIALDIVGKRTWWVWRAFFATTISGIFNSMLLVTWVFIAPDVPFRCKVTALDNSNFTEEQQRNITDTFGKHVCSIPDLDYESLAKLPIDDAQKKAEEDRKTAGSVKCHEFVFAEKGTSAIEEFSLVCDQQWLLPTLQMVVPAGMIFGAFIIGWISDDFGRKTGFITSCAIYMISAAFPFIIQTYWALCVARFTMGIANTGCYYSGLTLCVELASMRMRSTIGTLYNVSYAVGSVLLPIIAYFLPKWRDLLLAISVPIYLLFISIWVIPESPRWLATKGKYGKAWKILKKACKDVEGELSDDDISLKPQSKQERFKKSVQLIANFCMIKELLSRLTICLVVWFIVNLNYDLLPQNAANFGVNRYLMNGLLGLMEGISYIIPVVLLRYFPRRLVGAALFVSSGIALMLTLPVPREESWAQPLLLILIMLGRVTLCTLYAVIIVHTAELFPTEERATALGLAAVSAHLAGMVAPYMVTYLGNIEPQLPGGLCGVANIAIAVLVLILPETKGKPLVDTVEEMEKNKDEGEKASCLNICKMKM